MKIPNCIACEHTLVMHIENYGSTGHNLWFCEKCRLNHTHPLPSEDELYRYYQGFLFNVPSGSKADEREKILRENVRRMVNILIHDLKILPSEGRTLDYGGGVGITASEFSRLGFDSSFYDLDSKACEYAQNRFRNEIKILRNDAVDIQNDYYDLIYSSQVIEHLRDPGDHIRFLTSKLRKGGTLVITTPNQNTCEYLFRLKWLAYYFEKHHSPRRLKKFLSFMRQKWINFDPPRHLFGFNKHNLSLIAAKAGLNKVACFTEFGHRSVFNTPRSQPNWRAGLLPIPSQIYEVFGLKIASALRLSIFEGNNLVYIGRKMNGPE